MFLILSSQSWARSSIIGKDGKALDTQSIWCNLFEKFIKCYSSINDEIHRYQDVLQYASSKVDFNVGESVYLLPSNMVLTMGKRIGFNNNILVSNPSFKLGIKKLVNDNSCIKKRGLQEQEKRIV